MWSRVILDSSVGTWMALWPSFLLRACDSRSGYSVPDRLGNEISARQGSRVGLSIASNSRRFVYKHFSCSETTRPLRGQMFRASVWLSK